MLRRMFKEQMGLVEEGEDPTVGMIWDEHERIELPCEKDKFGAGAEFPLAWIDMGSMRYSPDKDTLMKIHVDAASAQVPPSAGTETE